MLGQAVASKMLLPDDQQVDTVPLGLLTDFAGFGHIRRVDRAVHSETIENRFGLIDQGFCLGARHELGQVAFAQLMNIVKLSVRKKARSADPGQNVTGLASETLLVVTHRAFSFQGLFAHFDQQHAQARILAEVIGCKHSGRAATHDDDVIFPLRALDTRIGHAFSFTGTDTCCVSSIAP